MRTGDLILSNRSTVSRLGLYEDPECLMLSSFIEVRDRTLALVLEINNRYQGDTYHGGLDDIYEKTVCVLLPCGSSGWTFKVHWDRVV